MTVTTDKKSEPEDNMRDNDENGAAADGLDEEKTVDAERQISEPSRTPMLLRASEGGGRVVSSSAPLR